MPRQDWTHKWGDPPTVRQILRPQYRPVPDGVGVKDDITLQNPEGAQPTRIALERPGQIFKGLENRLHQGESFIIGELTALVRCEELLDPTGVGDLPLPVLHVWFIRKAKPFRERLDRCSRRISQQVFWNVRHPGLAKYHASAAAGWCRSSRGGRIGTGRIFAQAAPVQPGAPRSCSSSGAALKQRDFRIPRTIRSPKGFSIILNTIGSLCRARKTPNSDPSSTESAMCRRAFEVLGSNLEVDPPFSRQAI
jgi:hypothetical protein